MFCSKCGQQQASEDVRFCSRCGLKLKELEERLGLRFAAMAMYLFIIFLAWIGWGPASGPAFAQARALIAVLATITFFLLFSRDLMRVYSRLLSAKMEPSRQVGPAVRETALPPPQSVPIASLNPQRVNTAEMVQPPSVTDRTTLLLEENRR